MVQQYLIKRDLRSNMTLYVVYPIRSIVMNGNSGKTKH